ncbi:TIGR01777 family oxidoreductase [Flavobacteriales bacterium]|nr:TIGR01777 family oxidoreductase [Flavobacteriales bacterium]MDB4088635.1 TIGR01777 family oxidoreductase [Flavobacteriales bacterium]
MKGTDALINLTGKSVDCRYTEKNKKEIFDSRTNSIEVLEKAFNEIAETPKVWIQAATATIYRDEDENPNDEYEGKIGEGFSVEVAKKWEQTFESVSLETKKVFLRMTIVLGKKGGAFPVLNKMTKIGFGGKQGNGEQMISWIHIENLVNIIDLSIKNQWVSGVINCTSPEPIKNEDFMRKLRKRNFLSFGIPIHKCLLRFGAKIIRTEPELILKSRWVSSVKLNKFGYSFIYPTLDKALESLK